MYEIHKHRHTHWGLSPALGTMQKILNNHYQDFNSYILELSGIIDNFISQVFDIYISIYLKLPFYMSCQLNACSAILNILISPFSAIFFLFFKLRCCCLCFKTSRHISKRSNLLDVKFILSEFALYKRDCYCMVWLTHPLNFPYFLSIILSRYNSHPSCWPVLRPICMLIVKM